MFLIHGIALVDLDYPTVACVLGSRVSAPSDVLYENEDLYEDGGCMRICIRTRVIRLMLEHTRTHMGDCTYTGLWPSR